MGLEENRQIVLGFLEKLGSQGLCCPTSDGSDAAFISGYYAKRRSTDSIQA